MKLITVLFLGLPFLAISQTQIYLNLGTGKDHYNTVQTKSQPNSGNPSTRFEYAFVSNCRKILGNDFFIYKDSMNYDSKVSNVEKIPYTKWINHEELVGIIFEGEFSLEEGVLKFNNETQSPVFDVSHWTDTEIKNKELFSLPMTGKCKNADYSFLVKSYIDQDEIPEIRDLLCRIYDGQEGYDILNFELERTALPLVRASMIKIDTFIVTNCYDPNDPIGEHVYITKTEYFFDDLDIALYCEINYCAESSTFDMNVLYYGLALPIVDPETNVLKYRKTKFLIANQ